MGIAAGISEGLRAGQEFIANEQQQKVRDKQMAEIERAERKRSAMAAIDMSDRGKALAGMQQVSQEYGDPEAYLKYGDTAAADAAKLKKQEVLSLASALESGDFATANTLGPKFGLKGTIAGFNPKTNSYRMHIPDPKSPDKYTAADVSYDKIQRGLWLSLGGEDAMKGMQDLNLKREQFGLEREKLAIDRARVGQGDRPQVASLSLDVLDAGSGEGHKMPLRAITMRDGTTRYEGLDGKPINPEILAQATAGRRPVVGAVSPYSQQMATLLSTTRDMSDPEHQAAFQKNYTMLRKQHQVATMPQEEQVLKAMAFKAQNPRATPEEVFGALTTLGFSPDVARNVVQSTRVSGVPPLNRQGVQRGAQ